MSGVPLEPSHKAHPLGISSKSPTYGRIVPIGNSKLLPCEIRYLPRIICGLIIRPQSYLRNIIVIILMKMDGVNYQMD